MNFTFDSALRSNIEQNLAQHSPRSIVDDSLRHASVAATLVNADKGDEAAFILTRRSSRLRRHGGQWALPGGRVDDDETSELACLRELSEEVGVHLNPDAILGRMDDYTTRSGFRISSYVVWAGDTPDFDINPDEVAFALRIPLRDLIDPRNPQLDRIPESSLPVLSMFLPIVGHEIYAPTAAVLLQLREIALLGQACDITGYDQPLFAWK